MSLCGRQNLYRHNCCSIPQHFSDKGKQPERRPANAPGSRLSNELPVTRQHDKTLTLSFIHCVGKSPMPAIDEVPAMLLETKGAHQAVYVE